MTSKKKTRKIQESKTKNTEESISNKIITINRQHELHDWSDKLTFKQLSETIYIVGTYFDEPELLSEEDKAEIVNWLLRNDIEKFLKYKDAALREQAALYEEQLYAREIMAYKSKKETWN